MKQKITEGLNFILNNPRGYVGVIIELDGEFGKEVPVNPDIIFIDPCDLLMWDAESMAFRHGGNVIFMDSQLQVTRKGGQELATAHKFGKIPVWDASNRFIQSYVKFADEVAKNFSDDGMMTKQYSYPIMQVVAPQCPKCNGQKVVPVAIEGQENAYKKELCGNCNGTGKLSLNPGDRYTMTEEQLYKAGGTMPDLVKYHTPDIGIPKYHMERVMEYYNKCEDSLYLRKRINATESGDAKKEDRKDQYAFLSTISRFLFDNIHTALVYISAYKNYNNATQRYEPKNVIVIAPKQLDLMTDSDLVNELLNIQAKTDDSMILAENQYAVTNKIYRDDNVQSKINDILYQVDPLYGCTLVSLKNKLLSGVYDNTDKVIHEKGYKILLRMSIEMTAERFINTDTSVLIEKFNQAIPAFVPKGIYSETI
jgi:hypothetical protein